VQLGLALALPIALTAWIALRRLVPNGRVDLTALVYLRAPLNALAFRVRALLGRAPRAARVESEAKSDLFDYLSGADATAAVARTRDLEQSFDLRALRDASTRDVYRDNLYRLDILDRLVTPYLDTTAGSLRAIDAGSQDFRYATALERWLRHAGTLVPRDVALDGVEVDGHGLYPDLSTRASHADRHASLTGNSRVRYRIENFSETHDRGIDVVFAWFPFVLRYALLRWGLPLRFFAPRRFFERASDALAGGGLLVVVTHTHEERDRLREILAPMTELRVVAASPAPSRLVAYWDEVPERWVTIAEKRRGP